MPGIIFEMICVCESEFVPNKSRQVQFPSNEQNSRVRSLFIRRSYAIRSTQFVQLRGSLARLGSHGNADCLNFNFPAYTLAGGVRVGAVV